MGKPQKSDKVKLFVAGISGSAETLEGARRKLVEKYGAIDHESATHPYEQGDYYAEEMGPSLLRRFWCFERLIDAGELAAVKLWTNGVEAAITKARSGAGVERPVNLDPGYIHLARVVIASTKDFTYRIYLHDGIYAEIALTYRAGGFSENRWTDPSWKTETAITFADEARKLYAKQVVQNGMPTRMIPRKQ